MTAEAPFAATEQSFQDEHVNALLRAQEQMMNQIKELAQPSAKAAQAANEAAEAARTRSEGVRSPQNSEGGRRPKSAENKNVQDANPIETNALSKDNLRHHSEIQ